MPHHLFDVSFRFRSYDQDIYEVDGQAVAHWDFADGSGATPDGEVEIYSINLTYATIDGVRVSWSDLKNFEGNYADDYANDLWYIAKQSIDGMLA